MELLKREKELDIIWEIWGDGESAEIIVKDANDESRFIKAQYEYCYPTIFGYDVADIAYINKLLDDLIYKFTNK